MLFWKSHDMFGFYFESQWYVFSLQTGDGIYDIFDTTTTVAMVYGYFFTLIYTFLIISTVQSIFMVIVEDAYVSAKYSKKYSWIVELEDQPNSDQSSEEMDEIDVDSRLSKLE